MDLHLCSDLNKLVASSFFPTFTLIQRKCWTYTFAQPSKNRLPHHFFQHFLSYRENVGTNRLSHALISLWPSIISNISSHTEKMLESIGRARTINCQKMTREPSPCHLKKRSEWTAPFRSYMLLFSISAYYASSASSAGASSAGASSATSASSAASASSASASSATSSAGVSSA